MIVILLSKYLLTKLHIKYAYELRLVYFFYLAQYFGTFYES